MMEESTRKAINTAFDMGFLSGVVGMGVAAKRQ